MKIGIDLGGTRLHVALIKNNRIVREIRTAHKKKDKRSLLEELTSSIEKLINKDVKGIGIGVAGLVRNGKIVYSPNLKNLNEINLKKLIQNRFKVKVVIENDVNCFALWQGKKQQVKNLVCLTLGTGVGGGIVIDGKLYKGEDFAGELGHMVINEDGIKERSGKQGTLEAYCSGFGIEKRYHSLTRKRKSVVEIGKSKNKTAKKVIGETGRCLGIGLANIVNILNPEVIVVGGGIASIGALFPAAKKEMRKRILRGVKVRVVQNKIKGSTALGAASLV